MNTSPDNTVQPSSNEKSYEQSGFHQEITIPIDSLRMEAQKFYDKGYRLESHAIVDYPENFTGVYQFNRWENNHRICMKVQSQKNDPQFPTISDIYQGANWLEREAYDMYGVKFLNHPNLTRILLPESSTIHPLRKDFKAEGTDIEDVLKLIELEEKEQDRINKEALEKYQKDYFINMGPQHPSTHGVLRLLLRLDGEKVQECMPIIGYSHRAHEHMAECRNYAQFYPNMGRLDYVGALSYNQGYVGLIEKALGIQPTPRAEHIRVLTTELNRISSHLVWFGTFLLDLGAFTPFFYCFDDREDILDILEMLMGERLTYNYFRFGGLPYDLPDGFFERLQVFIPKLYQRLKDYEKLVEKNIIFIKRTEGIGILTKEEAFQYAVSGPILRGSGVNYDLRRQEPYSIYPDLDFEIPYFEGCDAFSRYRVRVAEMVQSLRIIEQVMKRMPEGPIRIDKMPKAQVRVPAGEYYFAVESPRGHFGCYLVSNGGAFPYRLKLRTPSFANLSMFSEMTKGLYIADIVSALGSIDVVIPEIDR